VADVAVVRAMLVAVLRSVTVARGIGKPLGSMTAPTTDADSN
jgi:hypothetical protein